MKLTAFFILISAFSVLAGKTYSQTKTLTLHMENAKVKEALAEIENQSEFRIMYSSMFIDVEREVSVNVKNQKIGAVLDLLFAGTDVGYTVQDRFIVLVTPELMNEVAETVSQQRAVSGKVTDESGQPLPGVTVVVKGTTQGTVTNADGEYSISSLPENATLQFSFVGMRSQEVVVGDQTTINVEMVVDAIGIEEVVAIGYGTQKKVNLTGSVTVADKEIFENKAVPNVISAIQGNLPGVTVTRTSGQPGDENNQIQIRGASSANTVNALVIVDGTVGSLNDLNPNDIESMTVLKDAAASSIYGSNAAGGVILVTTKKGVVGTPVFQVSSMYGLNAPSRLPKRLDSWVEMDMYNQAHINSGGMQRWSDRRLEWMQGINLDLPDETGVSPSMFPGERFVILPSRPNVWRAFDSVNTIDLVVAPYNPLHQHNLSVRGGTESSKYFISAGYYNRRGIMRHGDDDEERYTVRLNLDNKLNEHISLNTSLAYTNNNIYASSYSATSALQNAYHLWSTISTYNPEGDYLAGNGIWDSLVRARKEAGDDTRKNHMFDGKIDLNIKLLPDWNVNVIASKRIGTNKRNYFRRTLTYMGPLGVPTKITGNPNNMFKNQTLSDFSSLQAFSTYNLSIEDSHNFTLLGGYSFEDYRYELIQGNVKNLVTNDFFSLGWGDSNTATVNDEVLTSRTMAFFGRLNYNFQEKYLLEANLRYDASSKLAPDVRWNMFPSFSAGWNVSREDFFQEINFISGLKIRASWGQLGNSDALGYYDYIGLLSANSNLPFNNSPTQYIYQKRLASESKTWETIQTGNLGLDVSFLSNRLAFTGDIYQKRNKNMLANLQVSSLIGVGLPSFNVGELETRGWEFSLTWREMSGDFKYWATFNLSDNTNKLVRYEGRDIVNAGTIELLEGYPLNSMWGYESDGLFQSNQEYEDYGVFIHPNTGEGDMKYVDRDGSKKINAGEGSLDDFGDLVHLGDNNPRYVFGLNLGFEWKGVDFSCLFQGVGKRNFFLRVSEFKPMYRDWKMPWKEHLDYWTTENRDAFWPRLYRDSEHSYWPSDHWIQDGSYIRLKNLEIGYTLPQRITQKLAIEKTRLFITGQDLFEFTNVFSWIDPEFPNNAGNVYPFYRSASIGINITF